MHWTPFARTKRRTRRASWRLRPCRALKNWLSRHRPSGRRPRRRSGRRFSRRGQRRLVYRARAGLRHDHSRRRRNGSGWPRQRRTLDLHLRDITMRRRLHRWRSASGVRCGSRRRASRRKSDTRRRGTRGRCRRSWRGWDHGNFGRDHDHRRRAVSGSHRSRRHHSGGWGLRRLGRRSWGHFRRRRWSCSFGSGFHRWRRSGRLDYRARCGLLNRSLLLGDGAQHIPGPRDMREVDLGLDAFFFSSGTRTPRRTRRRLRATAEMLPHQFRFEIL
jgi:hypothetical protein